MFFPRSFTRSGGGYYIVSILSIISLLCFRNRKDLYRREGEEEEEEGEILFLYLT